MSETQNKKGDTKVKKTTKKIDIYETQIYKKFMSCAHVVDAGFASKEQHAAYNIAKADWYALVETYNSLGLSADL